MKFLEPINFKHSDKKPLVTDNITDSLEKKTNQSVQANKSIQDTQSVNNIDTNDDDFLDALSEERLPNEIRFSPNRRNSELEQLQQQQQNIEEQNKSINESNINKSNEIDSKDKQAKDLEMMHNYILTGKLIQPIRIFNMQWYMHIITLQESEDVISRAESYNEDSKQWAQVLIMLSYAVDQIEDHKFKSFEETRDFLEQLPLQMLYKIIEKYNELFKQQEDLMSKPQLLRNLVQNDFLRIKYQVMKNTGLVPADSRVSKMNDAQWLWYYYNMEEDLEQQTDIRQSELDYLGIFMNPKMAQEMIKVNERARKKRRAEKKKMYKAMATTTEEPVSSSLDDVFGEDTMAYQSDNTTVNTEFEKELQAALGGNTNQQFTELFDDESAGNPYEDMDDFMERVNAFKQFAGTDYGYKKPQKIKINPFIRNQSNNSQPIDKNEMIDKGKQLIQNNQSNKASQTNNDLQPKWKRDSDREFIKKTGINLNALPQQSVDIREELNKLPDDIDFMSIDDD